MSAFDIHINVVGTSIGAPSEDALKAGAPSALEVELLLGQQLPFAQGPGQPPIVAPLGKVRYALEREAAIEFFERGLEEAKKLPAKSNIEVAHSLDGVEKAAERLQKLSGNEG